MKPLIIIGAGGLGKETAWLVERINKKCPMWKLLGFLDDQVGIGTTIGKHSVLGTVAALANYADAAIVCAVGNTKIRRKIVDNVHQIVKNPTFATLIDPTVDIEDGVQVGEGSIICAQTICTVDIQIGKHVFIDFNCTIGHDAVIEDYVSIYPGVNVSGSTLIQSGVEMGTGVQMIQGKRVGENAIIGAGAVIVKDIPANCTAVGCPAKPIKYFK